ncbi:ABC transporter ATP-binding protein [Rhizobium sp. 'Codium 1']|uniref:ABC transporter ATP-binding protein n=1 Tax=Rhizobium sp. 'Codium 1' TaxID=2940484 RepID=UPI001E2D01C5|nr:ABC transporter ATP-binding protein [Rhizobium sp. 'Codium 1']MCC8934155.1 ABC transporter ATP-binding protein [Rhizobium sp. 'Codium 1']
MLEIRDFAVNYGKHEALQGVSLAMGEAEIVVMLGANGAGKSTLLKAIAGIVPARPGSSLSFSGQSLIGLPAHQVLEKGVALVPEGRGVFPDLSVAENLSLGAYARRARSGERENLERVFQLFPRLAERRRQVVGTMSGGEQQMVAIGRALMSAPRLLMLDEPSLGLAPVLVEELFGVLPAVRRSGVGLLIVEQNVRLSLSIADRGYLIEAGQIVGEGAALHLANDPAVQQAFLGATQ